MGHRLAGPSFLFKKCGKATRLEKQGGGENCHSAHDNEDRGHTWPPLLSFYQSLEQGY